MKKHFTKNLVITQEEEEEEFKSQVALVGYAKIVT